MAAIVIFAKQVWPIGERQVEAIIGSGISGARILFDRTSVAPGPEEREAMRLDLWLSDDNGATWTYALGAGFPDGGDTSKMCGMQAPRAYTDFVGDPPMPVTKFANRARIKFSTAKAMNVAVTLELF